MADIHTPQKLEELPLAVVKSMTALVTTGFGLVVALAWNDFIREAVETYIDPYLGKNSGMISLFLYATVITALAVFVTMQLAVLQRKMELIQEKLMRKKNC